jgi:hypothetical protein
MIKVLASFLIFKRLLAKMQLLFITPLVAEDVARVLRVPSAPHEVCILPSLSLQECMFYLQKGIEKDICLYL